MFHPRIEPFVVTFLAWAAFGCGGADVEDPDGPSRSAEDRDQTQFTNNEDPIAEQPELFEASDSNGHLISRGFRIRRGDGNYVRTGAWTFYYPNGLNKSQGNFSDDAKSGRWTYFNKDGTTDYQEDYENGETFYRIAYGGNPERIWEGAYRRGRAVGTGTTFYVSGEKRAEQERDPDGRLLAWVMYRKDGTQFASFNAGEYLLKRHRQPSSPFERNFEGYIMTEIEKAWKHAHTMLVLEEGK